MASTSTAIPYTVAIEVLEASITSYNWLTSPPPPLIQTIPQYHPSINKVHHAIAVIEAMAASTESIPDPDPIGYPDTEEDSYFGNSTLALRYAPTINSRSRNRIQKMKRWLRSKVRSLSRR